MARRKPQLSLRVIGDIQLTSMMDLSFLLLITFIITFPMIEQGIPVNLPQGKAEQLPPERSRTVTVDRNGKVHTEEGEVTLERFAAAMRSLRAGGPDVTVLVRADEAVAYREVVKVLKVLHDEKITRVALVTRDEQKGR
jgi:biopolymer transport protein TolR